MDQTQYLKEQAKITASKMVQDITEGNGGHASKFIKELLRDYFKPLYIARGMYGLKDALEKYLNYMENEEGLAGIEYFVGEKATKREDYINKVAEKVQAETDDEEIQEPGSNERTLRNWLMTESSTLEQEQDESNPPFELSWEMLNEMSTISLFEKAIKSDYAVLVAYHKEEAKIAKLKEQVVERLAENITEWSHIKFDQPRNNERGVQLYVGNRNEALRGLMRNYDVHKALHRKIRKIDTWGKVSLLGDEQPVGTGICRNNKVKSSHGHGYML